MIQRVLDHELPAPVFLNMADSRNRVAKSWSEFHKDVGPQSAAILDGAQRLVRLHLADDARAYPFLGGDSLELDQRCPSDELEESSLRNG